MIKRTLTYSNLLMLAKEYNQIDFGPLEIEIDEEDLSSIMANNVINSLNKMNVEQAVESGTTNFGPLTARMISYYFGLSENVIRYGIEGIIKNDTDNQQAFHIDEDHKTFSDAGVTNQDIAAFWAENAPRYKSKSKMHTLGSPNDVGRRFVRRSSFEKWVRFDETQYLRYKRVPYIKGITFYDKETGKVKASLSCFDLLSVKQPRLLAV